MNNPNHPKKGSSIKVEPIRSKKAIERIKADLLHRGKYRDHCFFVLGINTAYRANELLSITTRQAETILNAGPGCRFEIKQSKNKKYRPVTINRTAYAALELYFKHDDEMRNTRNKPDAPLFYSERGDVLKVPSVVRMVKSWCAGAGCKGNYGSHTLRKTWGYHQYKAGTPLPILMEAYGHATQQQTLAYLCIQSVEIEAVYELEL